MHFCEGKLLKERFAAQGERKTQILVKESDPVRFTVGIFSIRRLFCQQFLVLDQVEGIGWRRDLVIGLVVVLAAGGKLRLQVPLHLVFKVVTESIGDGENLPLFVAAFKGN